MEQMGNGKRKYITLITMQIVYLEKLRLSASLIGTRPIRMVQLYMTKQYKKFQKNIVR